MARGPSLEGKTHGAPSGESAETPSARVGTRLLHEDDFRRVWLLDLDPGEATEWHQHDSDYVFVVTQSGVVRTEYADGSTETQDGDDLGHAEYRQRDTPHRLVNVGDHPYGNVVIELKPRH
ncbi:MAG: hypothetical protein QOJ29_4553 [Thermoleophilaceae bacterium]|jgi:quercetin dioxygenase-like cupin family protein|nr:hypothetical protein [Thermoleophilaceae bacterium]